MDRKFSCCWMDHSPSLFFAFTLLCSVAVTTLAYQERVKIKNEKLSKINVGDIVYLSLPRIVSLLEGKLWLLDDKVICLLPDSANELKKEFLFTLNSNLALVSGREVLLSAPVMKQGEHILFPLLSLKEVFSVLPEEEMEEISFITATTAKETTFYFFAIDSSVSFYSRQLSSLSFELVIGAKLSLSQLSPKGIIREIKVDRSESAEPTRFRFYSSKPANFSLFRKKDGLLVKFYPFRGLVRAKEKFVLVLDPGHGGQDPGAVGKLGTKEKDLNLDIALRLKKRLVKAGYSVLLTREGDDFVSLSQRTEFANKNNADLFISIHCNASKENPRALGFETYFLSEAKTDLERACALKENEVLRLEKKPFFNEDLEIILSDLAQTEFLKESEELACAIQDAADRYLGLANRGVKQAGFYVLRFSLMPSVLVECGFLSNRREERLLRDGKMREKIVEALFRGITNFISTYEKKVANQSMGR